MGQKTGQMYEMKELEETCQENNTKDDVTPKKSEEKQRCSGSLGIKMFTFFGCIIIALIIIALIVTEHLLTEQTTY